MNFNALNQPIALNAPGRLPSGNYLWFAHDPLGRCVKRWISPSNLTFPNGATYFYYDNWNLIQEGAWGGSATRIYAHGNRVDEIVADYSYSDNQFRYHHYDARGHCILLTNSLGNLIEQYDYDAFGQPYFFTGGGAVLPNGTVQGNRFLFTGREWLPELRGYDYRNRHYIPQLGRFLQPDPKHFLAGDYNLYRYCHNDPVNKSDPMGLESPTIDERIRKKTEEQMKTLSEKRESFRRELAKLAANKNKNRIGDAQSPDNRTAARTPNGLKPNRTDAPPYTLGDFVRDLVGIFRGGGSGSTSKGTTSFYDPYNNQTATGRIRPPIFGLANELGHMFDANNGTWGQGGTRASENRSIWWENEARQALGADLRPYE
jgi:RHS repeat-associated protein